MKFYGEGGIDKVIREAFFPSRTYKGVIVEVGAGHPTFLNISKYFRDSGWNAISIEPNPYFAKLHREAGNNILEYACGEKDEDDIEFEVVSPKFEGTMGQLTYESFSAIRVMEAYKQKDPFHYSKMKVEKIRVNMRRLDTLLRETGITFIDILIVDTEGWELQVLSGLDFNLHAPKLMVVENWLQDAKYIKQIVDYGYNFVCQIFPNDIYEKIGMFSKAIK